MKSLYEGGVTTAGNASGVNDGAVAIMMGSLKAGEKAGSKPIARIVATASAGVPPHIMGIGPVAGVEESPRARRPHASRTWT